jgi:two-component system NtrC family sensor kinase
MMISLRTRLGLGFLIVAVITGLVASWVGVHLIGDSIVHRAQRQVETDLNSAREIYQAKLNDTRSLIRLTASRFFIKDALISGSTRNLSDELDSIREDEDLDVLTLTDDRGSIIACSRNPLSVGTSEANDELVQAALLHKKAVASTQIISQERLMSEAEDLAEQAHMKFVPTPKAKPTEREEQTSGMMIKAAAPVMDSDRLLGVLYGGTLLNRDYEIVDKIKDIVYRGEMYEGKDIGTATIFQKDLRISTNVRKSDGERAIGTRVSQEVYEQVVEKGTPWFARAFVVNDWYMTAYEPIRNIRNEVVGILYVGILEKKFIDLRKRTLLTFLLITTAGALISLIVACLLANGIIKPIKCLAHASKQIAGGNLEAQVECSSRDEIGELGQTFNSMASSLKERDQKLKEYAEQEIMKSDRLATLGQIAAGVAHEINNPLAVILGRAELLNSEIENASPVVRKSLNTIEQEAEKAASTIQKFLSFARQPEPKFELADINKLLENSLTLASHQALIDEIKINKKLSKGMPRILLDPQQIQQVFINIILNAFQAMQTGGNLSVTSHLADGFAEAKFTDTGCGIAKDDLLKIFEPFFTTKKRGTGLGLAISKSIIDKHKGSMKIESEPDKGSTVIIRLPVQTEA